MTRPADPVCGVVLSGGQSRRMQTDKAALEIDGKSLLAHAENLLGASGCQPVLVSGRPDLPNGIADTHPGGGPAHAILDAADAMPEQCRGLIIIPVDMPGLTPQDLEPLMARDAQAVHWNEFQLPLFLRADLVRPPRDDIWSVKRLLSLQETATLPIDSSRQRRFSNLNTPEDVKRFLDMKTRGFPGIGDR